MAPISFSRGTVSAVVIAPDIVDFEWDNGCSSNTFRESANGYLRGSTLLVRMNSDDAKLEVACEVRDDTPTMTFIITQIHGMHTGLTSYDDRNIDAHKLHHDAALRERMKLDRSDRMTRERWAGEKTYTDFECIVVVTEMLRTLRPGWNVVFDVPPAGDDARPLLNSVLGSHITLLMEGVTLAKLGVQRMVYM